MQEFARLPVASRLQLLVLDDFYPVPIWIYILLLLV
jgi:hypothetical protein